MYLIGTYLRETSTCLFEERRTTQDSNEVRPALLEQGDEGGCPYWKSVHMYPMTFDYAPGIKTRLY